MLLGISYVRYGVAIVVLRVLRKRRSYAATIVLVFVKMRLNYFSWYIIDLAIFIKYDICEQTAYHYKIKITISVTYN